MTCPYAGAVVRAGGVDAARAALPRLPQQDHQPSRQSVELGDVGTAKPLAKPPPKGQPPAMTTTDPTPQTGNERNASAQAIIKERKANERDAHVDALTDRERLLIELAWEAGARTTRDQFLKKLNNPHAATLDAAAVTQTLNELRDLPTVYQREQWWHNSHYDDRIISIVLRAQREINTKPNESTT